MTITATEAVEYKLKTPILRLVSLEEVLGGTGVLKGCWLCATPSLREKEDE